VDSSGTATYTSCVRKSGIAGNGSPVDVDREGKVARAEVGEHRRQVRFRNIGEQVMGLVDTWLKAPFQLGQGEIAV
jgi:hypothetical protein